MSTDKTLAQELCEQINVWDMFAAIDDEDDLVTNVILPAFQKRIVALAEAQEARINRWLEERSEDQDAWNLGYSSGRHRAAAEAAQVLRAFAYELTAEKRA